MHTRHRPRARFAGVGSILLALAAVSPLELSAADPLENHDSRGRATAVSLNYCRASFHRIRKLPLKPVLLEERERILDNLNVNGIGDEAVIKLYSAVLDEIGQVEIADREEWIIRENFRREFRERLATAVFASGLHVASGQYLAAVRTGAASWWDYRTMNYRSDVEAWRVEKVRLEAVVAKSSQFLDTFWKLARDKNIPDRWLVRDDDLDRLEEAVREEDPKVRLRVLERMERFMECYPPYWYYLARTQQELGRLFDAVETYDHMADLGTGYFRKDELLASGMANRAMIQTYLHQPEAVRTAREALAYADGVWPANLLCATVLEKHGHLDEAEDAILRNLDTGLEREHSAGALIGLYHRAGEKRKLAKWLADERIVADVPTPALIAACTAFEPGEVPPAARHRLADTLQVRPDLRFGPDDLVLVARPNWQLDRAGVALQIGNAAHQKAARKAEENRHEARFGSTVDWGGPLGRVGYAGPLAVDLAYADGTRVRVHLARRPGHALGAATVSTSTDDDEAATDPLPLRGDAFVPIAIDVDGKRVHLGDDAKSAPQRSSGPPVPVPEPR